MMITGYESNVTLPQTSDQDHLEYELIYDTQQNSTIREARLSKKNKVYIDFKQPKGTDVMTLPTNIVLELSEKFTKIHNQYINNFKVKTQFYLVTEDVFTNAIVVSREGRLLQCVLHPDDCRLMLCIPITEEEYLGRKEDLRRMKEECERSRNLMPNPDIAKCD